MTDKTHANGMVQGGTILGVKHSDQKPVLLEPGESFIPVEMARELYGELKEFQDFYMKYHCRHMWE